MFSLGMQICLLVEIFLGLMLLMGLLRANAELIYLLKLIKLLL